MAKTYAKSKLLGLREKPVKCRDGENWSTISRGFTVLIEVRPLPSYLNECECVNAANKNSSSSWNDERRTQWLFFNHKDPSFEVRSSKALAGLLSIQKKTKMQQASDVMSFGSTGLCRIFSSQLTTASVKIDPWIGTWYSILLNRRCQRYNSRVRNVRTSGSLGEFCSYSFCSTSPCPSFVFYVCAYVFPAIMFPLCL